MKESKKCLRRAMVIASKTCIPFIFVFFKIICGQKYFYILCCNENVSTPDF